VSAMRMQVFGAASGVTVVNDAYNANPSSMRAAIETLAAMQVNGRRIAVLGDMAELGSLTELAHFRVGEQVAHLGIDTLATVGPRALRIGEGARAAGLAASSVSAFESAEEAGAAVAEMASPGDAVLVKASRVMGLESVVDQLVGSQ
jgi:UDP-N-acetylmuramoyl-tripeptide--D-alanyl-D-alanine ligase